MQLGDLDEVMEIELYSFPTPWERRMYEFDLTANEHSRFYVAVDETQSVIAYIGNWFVLDECHVGTIAVKSENRRQGIAELLLGFTAAKALEEGLQYIILEVRETNAAAIRLYEKLGFKIVGRRKGYYQDTGEDANLMMHKDIPSLATYRAE